MPKVKSQPFPLAESVASLAKPTDTMLVTTAMPAEGPSLGTPIKVPRMATS